MKRTVFSTLLLITAIALHSYAQVENVIVELYYISDATDATDTTGGGLQAGSKTFRVFIDLKPGTILKKIYGDDNHPLRFSGTQPYFNNAADGQTFAKDFSKSRYGENTVALDSWLTLGQTTRLSAKTYFGVLKSLDVSGSFIGGTNNDGGSAGIPTGLLTNDEPEAGIPITIADGMDTMANVPGNWTSYGFEDSLSGADSTLFGSLKVSNEFVSYNAGLQCTGVTGVSPDSNLVIVAQITTLGTISFELNIEVDEPDGSNYVTKQYVADGTVLLHDATHNEYACALLKYPQACGCTDPNYLEYSTAWSCSNNDSCHTPIVFGCMDTSACNFNPLANFNLPGLCCYPGFCNDRDITVICPVLSFERHRNLEFNLFPNPVRDVMRLQLPAAEGSEVHIAVYDGLGRLVMEQTLDNTGSGIDRELPVEKLATGTYIFQLSVGKATDQVLLIKE